MACSLSFVAHLFLVGLKTQAMENEGKVERVLWSSCHPPGLDQKLQHLLVGMGLGVSHCRNKSPSSWSDAGLPSSFS